MIEWTKGKPAEAFEMVWVWHGDYVFMGYVDDRGIWFDNNKYKVNAEVTHWQEIEIPEPPQEDIND